MTESTPTTRLLSETQIDETANAIAQWQLRSGMIPWFPEGHSDPWNHIEAAMALATAGRIEEAEKAYDWLVGLQHDSGAWHQYYVADGVEQDKLDANVIAYIATGVWHHWLITDDRGFLESMFPVVERAIDWVFKLQQPRGEILWARHADGSPWSFALLTGSSSMYHSTRAALAISREVGSERTDWIEPISRLGKVIREQPDGAFAPKNRWAMDWYYPVLSGVVTGDAGRARLAERSETFIEAGRGVRCVSDRPWFTVAETCEAMMAHLVVGEVETARELFTSAAAQRLEGGRYFTGLVYPQLATFPPAEQSTYTSAAVVLGADALGGTSPASWLFVEHERLPPIIETEETLSDRLAE